jgi:hypothetical protein
VSLLKAAEIAQELGLSTPMVRKLWNTGALPFVEIPSTAVGRRIRRTDAAALEVWIATHSSKAADTDAPGKE